MKKIIILSSVITPASCSLLPNDGENDNEAIKEAQQAAQENTSQYTDQEIDRTRKEIDNTVTSVISRADSALANQFTTVEKSFNAEAEETRKELGGEVSGIEDNIAKAKVISFVGIAIRILGIVLAFFAYRKRPRTDVDKVKGIITEEINANNYIRNEVRRIAEGQSSSYRPQTSAPSQTTISRAIEAYLASKKFKDILQQYIALATAPTQSVTKNVKVEPATTAKPVCQIYAKESNSMIFSSVQDTYQKGKPIYRLAVSGASAYTAEIGIYIKQKEVKQHILKFDSQYLKPICFVTRSSNDPTQVLIKTTGTVEHIGEEWKVIRPITVKIK